MKRFVAPSPAEHTVPGKAELKEPSVCVAAALEGHSIPWRRKTAQRVLKRAFDLVGASVMTVLLLPVAVVVGLLVRITSKGPVLLAQPRLGLNGREFAMYKFRSMLASRRDGFATGGGEVAAGDRRLTPIGLWLRAWRLDELPQLPLVLTGKMSLVGPRPLLPEHINLCSPRQLLRFAMPPGCTGWTVTRGGYRSDWSAMQDIQAEYVEAWTLLLDLKILLGTVRVLLSQKETTPPGEATPPSLDTPPTKD